jgi:hypothetical protein
MTGQRFTAATCALLLTLSGTAPADQKPTPPPSSGTLSKGSAPGVPLVTVIQKPDLVVSFEGSGPGLPTGFTVKNIGNVDSKLSVLKVTATFVPPPGGSGGGSGSGSCPPSMTPADCADLMAFAAGLLGALTSIGNGGGPSSDSMKKACGNPFPEFLEAVPVLKPGESKTFMRDTGGYQVSISGFVAQPLSPQATHVKQCSPTLVCAWDVKAVADASNDNDERNEANNTSTRRALREVSFK